MDIILDITAARMASILVGWLGLSAIRKADSGDKSKHAALALMLHASVKAGVKQPPHDAEARIRQHLSALLRREFKFDCLDIRFKIDYDPCPNTRALSVACDLDSAAWPIKSGLAVEIYPEDRVMIAARQGYGASRVSHYLVDTCSPAAVRPASVDSAAWLTTKSRVDGPLFPILMTAIMRGEADEIAELDRRSLGAPS